MEYIGHQCFSRSRIEQVTLPGTLKEIGKQTFEGCNDLKVVWLEDGCAPDIRASVGGSAVILPARHKMVGDELLWDLRG